MLNRSIFSFIFMFIFIATVAILIVPGEAHSNDCPYSWCDEAKQPSYKGSHARPGYREAARTRKPPRDVSVYPYRVRLFDRRNIVVGDLYYPAPGRRIQIRDRDRNILGYIETDGRITDTDRRTLRRLQNAY